MADVFKDRLDGSFKELSSHGDIRSRIDVPEDRKFVGFDAYQKALAAGPDLVILATPPGFRPIHFEAAVNAGKHVFMEKPVATDAAGVRRVLAAAEESKKTQPGRRRRTATPPPERLPGDDQAAARRRHRRHRLHSRLLERLDPLGPQARRS